MTHLDIYHFILAVGQGYREASYTGSVGSSCPPTPHALYFFLYALMKTYIGEGDLREDLPPVGVEDKKTVVATGSRPNAQHRLRCCRFSGIGLGNLNGGVGTKRASAL